MVNESFRDLYLEVVDLQQDLSSFWSVVWARRALERMHHAVRHTIQAIATSYTYHTFVLNSANKHSIFNDTCTNQAAV